MPAGAITGYIDVAQLTLYAFWIFFAGLIFYLRREDKREGYPLESDRAGTVRVQGFPPMPRPKVFHLADGSRRYAPRQEGPAAIAAVSSGAWTGAPMLPTGTPMLDGVGPASYAQRPESPDIDDPDVGPKLRPMRVATEFSIAEQDPDPRGMAAVGGDRMVGGTVVDCWVDRSEILIRYLEIEAIGGRRVLVPMPLVRVDRRRRRVFVKSVLGSQFAGAPALSDPDQVTMREEDQISAYYGGGTMYADLGRQGPVL